MTRFDGFRTDQDALSFYCSEVGVLALYLKQAQSAFEAGDDDKARASVDQGVEAYERRRAIIEEQAQPLLDEYGLVRCGSGGIHSLPRCSRCLT